MYRVLPFQSWLKRTVKSAVSHGRLAFCTTSKQRYLSLTYDTDKLEKIQSFLKIHDVHMYNSCTDYIETAIFAYEKQGDPVLELFVDDGLISEFAVTAANAEGEEIIKSMLQHHPQVNGTTMNVIEKPLPFTETD